MKTALMFSGLPRFHAELDDQLANLHGSEIDWIVVFWNNTPDNLDFKEALNPTWLESVKSESDARDWILQRLPKNHKLAHFSFHDWNDFPDTYVISDYPNQVTVEPPNTFRQYYMVKQVNLARQTAGNYDLVIRSRTDIGLHTPVYLNRVYQRLINEPMRIIVPSNNRQEDFNDLFAIGRPEAMDIYATAVDYFNESYFERNVTFHTENLVNHVLRRHGLYWGDDGYHAFVRTKGKYLTKNWTRGVPYYAPDFGRW